MAEGEYLLGLVSVLVSHSLTSPCDQNFHTNTHVSVTFSQSESLPQFKRIFSNFCSCVSENFWRNN